MVDKKRVSNNTPLTSIPLIPCVLHMRLHLLYLLYPISLFNCTCAGAHECAHVHACTHSFVYPGIGILNISSNLMPIFLDVDVVKANVKNMLCE